jgi:hypothetical protein
MLLTCLSKVAVAVAAVVDKLMILVAAGVVVAVAVARALYQETLLYQVVLHTL